MIISADEEKHLFRKFNTFHNKKSNKLAIEEKYSKIIKKVIYERPRANIILSSEKLSFPMCSGTRQVPPHSTQYWNSQPEQLDMKKTK